MIKITGRVKVSADFEVELDMNEAEFDALPYNRQIDVIDEAIDWKEVLRSSETDDIDVWDVVEATSDE